MGIADRLFDVSGRTALVTGGATGIGRMIAAALVAGGARVLIASRKAEACEAVAAELTAEGPGQAEGFAGDVGTAEGVAALAAAVAERTDALDILVNNAGVSWGQPLGDFPRHAWARVMEVNVAGLFDLTQALLPTLERAATDERPAAVLNVGSVMGTQPWADGAYSYSASKAAVHHLTRILASDLAPRRVRVNAIAPGPFRSGMTRFATGTDAQAARIGENVPLGRIGNADDLAAATLLLCSNAGAHVTGAVLPLDGGLSVHTRVHLFEGAGDVD